MTNEQDVAGKGCILNFFTDMYNCMDAVIDYTLGLQEMERKAPMPTKPEDQRKNILNPTLEDQVALLTATAKGIVMRCHLQLTGISKIVTGLDFKALDDIYKNKIYKEARPKKEDMQEYIQTLYNGFVTSTLKDMLKGIETYNELVK